MIFIQQGKNFKVIKKVDFGEASEKISPVLQPAIGLVIGEYIQVITGEIVMNLKNLRYNPERSIHIPENSLMYEERHIRSNLY